MITYADWGRKKDWIKIEVPSLENLLYIEEGCPLYALILILSEGIRVFKVSGTETTKLRKEKGWEKTDENDVKLIKELAETHPELFTELKEQDKDALYVKLHIGKYRDLTKIVAGLKNQEHAIVDEYGPSEGLEKSIKDLQSDKALQLESVLPHIQQEMDALSDVTGFGPALIAQICALAHPNKFKSKSAYLKYLGFIDRSKLEKADKTKYNRGAKAVFYNLMTQQMLHKTKYYDMLNEIKEKERLKTCESCYLTKNGSPCKRRKDNTQIVCNGKAHSSAQNKVMTALATLVYDKLHNIEVSKVVWHEEKEKEMDLNEVFA